MRFFKKPMYFGYILLISIFVLDIFSIVEIKVDFFKGIIHFGSLLMTIIVMIYAFIFNKTKNWKVMVSLYSIIVVVSFSIAISQKSFLGYLFSLSSWKTQTILYEHAHLGFKKIEFQMQDVGALGYNKRYVSVIYLIRWFMITQEIDPAIINGSEWVHVNRNVNELNIVY